MDDLALKLDLWKGLRAQLEALGEVFTERQHWMALDELVQADMLAEMQTRVELDTYVARLDFVSRRVSHHRTLAQRSKEPALVDASEDALMAAMSAPTSSSDPINQLAEVVPDMQQKLQTFWPDAGDLDALGKTGYKGKKGGGEKGSGGKGKGEKGPNGAINGSCWNCGVFGHRQSDCPGIVAGGGQQNQDKGSKNKGNKGDGKGFWTKGEGKGINEITWDSSYDGVASSSWRARTPGETTV